MAGRLDDWDQGALEAMGPGAWREYQRTLKWMRSFERTLKKEAGNQREEAKRLRREAKSS